MQRLDFSSVFEAHFEVVSDCPECGGQVIRPKVRKKNGDLIAGACPSCGYCEPLGAAKHITMTQPQAQLQALKNQSLNFYRGHSIWSSTSMQFKDFYGFKTDTTAQKQMFHFGSGVVNELEKGLVVHSYIGGPAGLGKSHLANGIALKYREVSGYKANVMFVDWRELLDRYKDGMDPKREDVRDRVKRTLDAFNRADLVVLDDLGSERDSEFNRDLCDRFWRVREDKSVIVTTNCTTDEIKAKYGERTFSRISKFAAGNSMMVGGQPDYRAAQRAI